MKFIKKCFLIKRILPHRKIENLRLQTWFRKKRHNFLSLKKILKFFFISISKLFSGTGKPSTEKIKSLLTGFRKMKFHRTKINLINFKILIFLKFLAGNKTPDYFQCQFSCIISVVTIILMIWSCTRNNYCFV